jgi:hypothetical protein
LPVEKIGATCVTKLMGLPPLSITGTSTGTTKSYLQPPMNNENIIKTRNRIFFFIVFNFFDDTKKGFNFRKKEAFFRSVYMIDLIIIQIID